jgi:hypothetical protein
MSFGNVSSTRDGERLFRQAIHYLRQASNFPGYSLPEHLQRRVYPFLDHDLDWL